MQIELDESNGAVETVTHGVTTLVMGMVDAPGGVPGEPGRRQPPESASMHKALRLHLVALEGAVGVAALRASCDPPVPGWSLWTNATSQPGEYASSRVTTYVPPSTGTSLVPYPLPVSDPGEPTLGIAGQLDGELTTPGHSDYLYLQLRADATVTTGFDAPCYLYYEVIG